PEGEQGKGPQILDPNPVKPKVKETKAAVPKQKIEEQTQKEDLIQKETQNTGPMPTIPGLNPFQGQMGNNADPVSWSYEAKKLEEGLYELRIEADIQPGWKIYSMFMEEGGPIPTSIEFEIGEYELVGEMEESPKAKGGYDEVFDMQVSSLKGKALYTQKIKTANPELLIEGELNFMTCDAEKCLFPAPESFSISLDESKQAILAEKASGPIDESFKIGSIDLGNPISACIEAIKTSDSLWVTFFLGLIGGFVALLTPCVFPMIPMTVSYFTKGSEDKKKGISQGVLYGFAIFLIYVLLSLPFHLFESVQSDILNVISTNPWLNFFFFLIFVAFAISFFGYFEITMPHKLTNKASSASDVGGLIGIFFMALTLVLVSFSCTGPILGGLLGATSISPEAGAFHLTAGMGGFGVGLGLPFALFAIFPGWLNSLPKSGGWMTTLKVNLGFIELGLAIKFLSRADLVWQAGFLKREIFIALWIVIGLAMIAYIFGWIRFPHDAPSKGIKGKQLAGAGIVLAFIIYLVPGLFKDEKAANLSLISGFPPPLYYSIYEKENKCPLGIDCFKDYEEGMAHARKVNKPVMLDFTGHACENCRRMEENVWVDKQVFDRIDKDYVLISLYVDDRTKLPETEQREIVMANGSKRKIRTIGNKWSVFQTQNFQHNTQPYYALISPDEKLLNNPVAYTPEVNDYLDFLECGLSAFEQTAQK
ncbi:MAG: cytochrome c biogenesis protein CcdA, partial [Bacteroidota bacterium]